jgi:hypothetical protein
LLDRLLMGDRRVERDHKLERKLKSSHDESLDVV